MSFGKLGSLGRGFGSLGALGGAGSTPSWVPNPSNAPDIAINWQTNQAWTKTGGLTTPTALGVTTTRSTARTNLLPTSPSGFAYSTFPANTLVRDSNGRQTYEGRTNFLLNSAAPATQTTASLATGTYTLWVNGAGSATPSAGTATISGAAAATNGTPNTFVVSGAGTVVVTVSGALNAFQLELNPGTVGLGTPLLITGGTTLAGAPDVTTMPVTLGSSYSFFEQAIPLAPATYVNNQFLGGIDSGNGNFRSALYRGGSNIIVLGDNTSVFWNAIIAGGPTGTLFNSASAWAANAQGASVNGTLITNATGTPYVGNTWRFGNDAGLANQFNGIATVDAIWLTQAVPNAQLQAMQ